MTTPSVLSKVHTFAQDLERVRSTRGETIPPRVPAQHLPTASVPPASATTPIKQTLQTTTGPIKLTAASGRDASYPATIITDKKRRTFNLTEEVSAAVGDWWNDKIKTIKGGKKPVYSVAAVERRKGVIETATTHTGRIATSDHKEIVAKLKQESKTPTIPVAQTPPTNTAAVPSIPLFAAPDDTPQIGYHGEETTETNIVTKTPNVPGIPPRIVSPEPIQPEPTITVTEVVKKRPRIEPTVPETPAIPAVTAADTHVTEDSTAVSIPTIEAEPSPAPVTPSVFAKINPSVPTPPPTTIATPGMTPTSPVRENAFALLAEIPKPTFPASSIKVKERITNQLKDRAPEPVNTKVTPSQFFAYTPYLVAGLFVVIIVGGIGYFMMTGTDTTTVPAELPSTDLPMSGIAGDSPTDTYMLDAVSAQLEAPTKNALFTAVKSSTGLGEGLYMVTPLAHDNAVPLQTREILTLFNRQLSADFVGNITNLQLGLYRDEPVILLSVSDETSARGGMFRWEETLSQDLSPWFGESIRSQNTSRVNGFADTVSAGRDVRVLKDEQGVERITYGFLNQSTVLITSNTTAFLNITESYNGN